MVKDIDETKLNETDRLGLACCRLNCWQWDEIVGPKPDDFDELPNYLPLRYKVKRFLHRVSKGKLYRTKHDYLMPVLDRLESEIGRDNASRCHWLFVLGKTDEEWRKWYYTEGGLVLEMMSAASK